MIECTEHQEIHLLFCVFDTETKKYSVKSYTFCNNCAVKLADSITYNQMDSIPRIVDGKITKVICNIKTNGYEYRWFGHDEDRQFFIENGDKWQ